MAVSKLVKQIQQKLELRGTKKQKVLKLSNDMKNELSWYFF